MPIEAMDYISKVGLSQIWNRIDTLFQRKGGGSLLTPPTNEELEKYLNGELSSLTGTEPIVVNNLDTIVEHVKNEVAIIQYIGKGVTVSINTIAEDLQGSGDSSTLVVENPPTITIANGLQFESAIGGFLIPVDCTISYLVKTESPVSFYSNPRRGVTGIFQYILSAYNVKTNTTIKQIVEKSLTITHSTSGGSRSMSFNESGSFSVTAGTYIGLRHQTKIVSGGINCSQFDSTVADVTLTISK